MNYAEALAGILQLIMKEAPILMSSANDVMEQWKQAGDPTPEQVADSEARLDMAHQRFLQAIADREDAKRLV